MYHSRGFTLIELLVVIAIMGILSSVALASLSESRANARDAQRLLDMRSIETALEMYRLQHGELPNETPAPGSPSTLAGWEVSYLPDFMEYLDFGSQPTPVDPLNSGPPSSMFAPRSDGPYFYTYHYYNNPARDGSYYGCDFSGPFAIFGIRATERRDPDTLPKAQCGPQPCPGGGIANVCRDWSNEFDYSVIILP